MASTSAVTYGELVGEAYARSDVERERLRETFDAATDRYERARPDYPAELFDTMIEMAGLQPGDRLLEVGPATGRATAELARRGFPITGVELGADLAGAASIRFAAWPNVTVAQDNFETWTPPDIPFDLVYAATAWHWIDPTVRYLRAAAALRPGGHLAVWSTGHVVPVGGDPFFEQIQDVYDEIGEGKPPGWRLPRPGELAELNLAGDSDGLFDQVATRHFNWETVYDAATYIELLNTFSRHLAMQDWQRERLFGEIRRRLAARPDGLLRRHWAAVLEVARLSASGSRPEGTDLAKTV